MRRVNGSIYDVGTAWRSSRIQFTKINNKEVIAKNRCEKHKKSSLVLSADSGCKHFGPGLR